MSIKLKIVFLIVILSALAFSVEAQAANCGLNLSDAPALRGFRLGMSPVEARHISGGNLKIKIKREGSFFGYFIEEPPPNFLAGVRALYLRFFEAKLFQIEFFFEPSPAVTTLEELTALTSTQTNLPPEIWTRKLNRAFINCNGFSLVADNILNPHIELTDDASRLLFDDAHKKSK